MRVLESSESVWDVGGRDHEYLKWVRLGVVGNVLAQTLNVYTFWFLRRSSGYFPIKSDKKIGQ